VSTRDRAEPYRAPAAPPPPDDVPSGARGLGKLSSSHFRRDLQGTLARVFGWSPALELYEGGLVLWSGTPERAEILFDDVDTIFYDYEAVLPLPRPRPQVTLVTAGGRRAELPRDVSGLDRILTVLHREIVQPVVARACEALKRGDAMTFGPVLIELDGVRLRDEVLPWEHLARVVVDWDTIVIQAVEPIGRFGWVPLRAVPHPRALLAVLRMRGPVLLRGRTVEPGG
jgi:hypothetical protein